MKLVTVSAPGKIHLSAAHAVVYGKPAVLVATNRRLSVTISRIKNKDLRIKNDVSQIRKQDQYINEICSVFEKRHQLTIQQFNNLTISSDIPQSRGMGSSASLAVALIGALTKWYKKPWNIQEINELAYQSEKFIHTNSSGGDVSIVCHGGILWYRKEFEFLKTFWALSFKFPPKFSQFILIDTGRSESTGEMVKMVGILRLRLGSKFKNVLNQVEEDMKKMILAIKLNDEKLFKDSLYKNEIFLEKIGVVSKNVKKMIREIEMTGGVAKVSGAGGIKTGSGIVVSLPKNKQALVDIVKKYQYSYFEVKLGGEGVRVEKVSV